MPQQLPGDKPHAREVSLNNDKTHKAKNVEPLPEWLCIHTVEQHREWLRGIYRDGKPFTWMDK